MYLLREVVDICSDGVLFKMWIRLNYKPTLQIKISFLVPSITIYENKHGCVCVYKRF